MNKNTNIKCSKVFNYICDRLDENFNSLKCRIIKKHLDGCPNCSAYLDSLKKTILLYKTYPQIKAPRGSTNKILTKLKI